MDMTAASEPASVTVTPWTVIVTAVIWLGSLEFAILNHQLGLYSAIGVGVVLVASSLWQWWKHWATNVAALTTIVIAVTTLTSLAFVPGGWEQQVVVAMSVVLLWLVGRQRLRLHDDLRGRTMAFATAVLVWFSWFSALSASIYLNLNILWLMGGAAIMTSVSSLLVWIESGLTWRQYRWGMLMMVWLGAVLFIVTWWLPTSLLVSSTVSTVFVALVIQATRHLLKGHWEEGRSRRYLMVGLSLIVLVLATARWI